MVSPASIVVEILQKIEDLGARDRYHSKVTTRVTVQPCDDVPACLCLFQVLLPPPSPPTCLCVLVLANQHPPDPYVSTVS